METPGRPIPGEYLDYFETYISLVPETDILSLLDMQIRDVRETMAAIDPTQWLILHAPYTWTLHQVIGHCIDTERIFGYRAARFAANDSTSLPGFDQDQFVANTDYNSVPMADLLDELDWTRNANAMLLQRQTAETWRRAGVADGKNMTVRAAAYILAGHVRYHLNIIRKRTGLA